MFNKQIDRVDTRLLWRVQRAEDERDRAVKAKLQAERRLDKVRENMIDLNAKYKDAYNRARKLQLALNKIQGQAEKVNNGG